MKHFTLAIFILFSEAHILTPKVVDNSCHRGDGTPLDPLKNISLYFERLGNDN